MGLVQQIFLSRGRMRRAAGRGRGWLPKAALFAAILMGLPGASAQPVAFDSDIIQQLNLRSPDYVVAVAMRFASGPQGVVIFLAGVQNVDFEAEPPPRPIVERLFWYVPGHPEYGAPRRAAGRQEGSAYSFQNVRIASQHEGMETEVVIGGTVYLAMWRYLATSPYSLGGWWKSSSRVTLRRGTESARYLVSRDSNVTRVGDGRQLHVVDLTQRPSLDLRAVEGGRMVVANLTLGDTTGRGRTWTYYFPLQNADSQIRVDAVDERGAVVETLQLRNTRGSFDQIDSWTGRFRRLQTDRTYTLRATVDLGMLGQVERSLPVTIFDY